MGSVVALCHRICGETRPTRSKAAASSDVIPEGFQLNFGQDRFIVDRKWVETGGNHAKSWNDTLSEVIVELTERTTRQNESIWGMAALL